METGTKATPYSSETEWTRRWERDYRSRWLETGGKFYPRPRTPRTLTVPFAGVASARAGAENDQHAGPGPAEPSIAVAP
jgi:hypothetical protein